MADKKVIVGSDITAQQMSEFWSQVALGKVNRRNFQKFLEEKKSYCVVHTFTVPVDETKTVEELVREGNFDWSNSDITSENFPKPTNGEKSEKEIALFHFNKTMTSDEAIAEMDKDGYRPATIWDLLGLAIAKSNLQREFPIIGLGSVCVIGGARHVAGLYGGVDGRGLDLFWFSPDWGDDCRFAGVRK